jgi:preprotein translocase subunit SecB
MNPSPLQLERYFFSKIQLDAHADAGAQPGYDLECSVEVGRANDNPRRFQVKLKISLHPPGKTAAQYTGEFEIVGFFQVAKTWPDDQVSRLVEANGPAVLFGALREMIANLTARGPWPQITLHSVTFVSAPSSQPTGKPKARAKTSIRKRSSVTTPPSKG